MNKKIQSEWYKSTQKANIQPQKPRKHNWSNPYPCCLQLHKKDWFLLGDSNTSYHMHFLRMTCHKMRWREPDRKKTQLCTCFNSVLAETKQGFHSKMGCKASLLLPALAHLTAGWKIFCSWATGVQVCWRSWRPEGFENVNRQTVYWFSRQLGSHGLSFP